MGKLWVAGAVGFLLAIGGLSDASAQSPRLVRSLSGPSGKLTGQDFVLDEVRARFVYPSDRSLTVYFEWECPPGDHELVATWIKPDGQTASISPPVRIQTTTTELKSYWQFQVSPALANGAWTVAIRIDGQPAGSLAFEIAGASDTAGRITLDHVYKVYGPAIASVYRIDETGRRVDSSSGVVIAANAVATSFQSIDGAPRLEVQLGDGRPALVSELWAVSRLGDWAVLKVDTGDVQPIPRGDTQPVVVGGRLAAFGSDSGTRVVAPVDVGAVSTPAGLPGQARRIRFSPAATEEAVGGPLIDEYGKVVGIIGGSVTPGLRISRQDLGVNPALSYVSAAATSATVISDIPLVLPSSARSLADLMRDGVLTTPLAPMPECTWGGTATEVPKSASDKRISPTKSFSRRSDATVSVFTFWAKKTKRTKGVLTVQVYDTSNRLLSSFPPQKVSLRDEEQRLSASFPTKDLSPGYYRIDVSWDGKPAWRTYIRIVD